MRDSRRNAVVASQRTRFALFSRFATAILAAFLAVEGRRLGHDLRSVLVWFWIDNVWPAQLSYVGRLTPGTLLADAHEFGWKRAMLRLAKGVYSTLVFAMNAAYALFFCYAIGRAVRSRDPIAVAIAGGVVLYSLAGGFIAAHEWRRNLVFYPALFSLLSFTPPSSRAANSQSTQPSGPK